MPDLARLRSTASLQNRATVILATVARLGRDSAKKALRYRLMQRPVDDFLFLGQMPRAVNVGSARFEKEGPGSMTRAYGVAGIGFEPMTFGL